MVDGTLLELFGPKCHQLEAMIVRGRGYMLTWDKYICRVGIWLDG